MSALVSLMTIVPAASAEQAMTGQKMGEWSEGTDNNCKPEFCKLCETVGGACVYITGFPCICVIIIRA